MRGKGKDEEMEEMEHNWRRDVEYEEGQPEAEKEEESEQVGEDRGRERQNRETERKK